MRLTRYQHVFTLVDEPCLSKLKVSVTIGRPWLSIARRRPWMRKVSVARIQHPLSNWTLVDDHCVLSIHVFGNVDSRSLDELEATTLLARNYWLLHKVGGGKGIRPDYGKRSARFRVEVHHLSTQSPLWNRDQEWLAVHIKRLQGVMRQVELPPQYFVSLHLEKSFTVWTTVQPVTIHWKFLLGKIICRMNDSPNCHDSLKIF